MAEISFDQVTKVYADGTEAVSAVDLEIEDGVLMVLVGPSGCGKTTLLRMVAGLEEITEGEIRIGDRVINDVEPKNRDLAMVFQNYALYPHMTCYENMAFGLKLRRMPKKEIDRRVRETAQTLGLTEQLKKKPRSLSGGQRQRGAMGRAIGRGPGAGGAWGPRLGARAEGFPGGGAAVEPGRKAASADANRDLAHPECAGH